MRYFLICSTGIFYLFQYHNLVREAQGKRRLAHCVVTHLLAKNQARSSYVVEHLIKYSASLDSWPWPIPRPGKKHRHLPASTTLGLVEWFSLFHLYFYCLNVAINVHLWLNVVTIDADTKATITSKSQNSLRHLCLKHAWYTRNVYLHSSCLHWSSQSEVWPEKSLIHNKYSRECERSKNALSAPWHIIFTYIVTHSSEYDGTYTHIRIYVHT